MIVVAEIVFHSLNGSESFTFTIFTKDKQQNQSMSLLVTCCPKLESFIGA